MKNGMKKFICFLLCVVMLSSFSVLTLAAEATNYITVGDDTFNGTLADAIEQASTSGEAVGIYGTVFTDPIGHRDDDTLIDDVTIQGMTEDAAIVINILFVDLNASNYDVLTIKGENVTIKDLTVDASLKVDYAIRLFSGCDNVLIENVTAKNGMRGAISVLTSGTADFINTNAANSYLGGFCFDALDASNVTFTDCSTSGNLRTGVLVRNGYGDVANLDLSGITCNENHFAVEDRLAGTIDSEEDGLTVPALINILAAPKNSNGETIDTSKAMFFTTIDTDYHHVRYGVSDYDVLDAMASITTSRYGFDTTIYYKSSAAAQLDVREGEEISAYSFIMVLFNRIKKFFEIIMSIFA